MAAAADGGGGGGGSGETVGSTSGLSRSSSSTDSSALHWLADLATQKAKDDPKGIVMLRKCQGRYWIIGCLFSSGLPSRLR